MAPRIRERFDSSVCEAHLRVGERLPGFAIYDITMDDGKPRPNVSIYGLGTLFIGWVLRIQHYVKIQMCARPDAEMRLAELVSRR